MGNSIWERVWNSREFSLKQNWIRSWTGDINAWEHRWVLAAAIKGWNLITASEVDGENGFGWKNSFAVYVFSHRNVPRHTFMFSSQRVNPMMCENRFCIEFDHPSVSHFQKYVIEFPGILISGSGKKICFTVQILCPWHTSQNGRTQKSAVKTF